MDLPNVKNNMMKICVPHPSIIESSMPFFGGRNTSPWTNFQPNSSWASSFKWKEQKKPKQILAISKLLWRHHASFWKQDRCNAFLAVRCRLRGNVKAHIRPFRRLLHVLFQIILYPSIVSSLTRSAREMAPMLRKETLASGDETLDFSK